MRSSSFIVARKRSLVSSAAVITAGLLFSAHTQAVTIYNWTGAGGNFNWTTTTNWNPTSTAAGPTTGDTAILGDTTSNRTIIYNTTVTNGLLGTLTMTQTDPFVNLLDMQRNSGLNIASNLTLGATSGTVQLFVDAPLTGSSFGNLTTPLLTLNSGGIVELANDSDGTHLNQNGIAGNVAINSGGILQLDQTVSSTATAGPFGITITGSVTMAPGGTLTQGVHAPNPIGFAAAYKTSGGVYNTVDRLGVNGSFTLSGGTFINGGSITNGVGSTQLFLSGPSNDIANLLAPSFHSDPTSGTIVSNYSNNTITDLVRMGNSNATLTTDSDLPGGLSVIDTTAGANNFTVAVGSHTPGRILTIGQIGISNKNNTGGTPTEKIQLTSDVSSAFIPNNGAQGLPGTAGTILTFDTNGHTLNLSSASNTVGFSIQGSGAANLAINNSAATTGTIDATWFNLGLQTGGSSVASNVNLVALGNAGGKTNDLSLGGGSGAIDPGSTFTYSGAGTSGTPDLLKSTNRNIGNLAVSAGYLKLSTSAITMGTVSTPSTLFVSGGTLDLGGFNLTAGNLNGTSTSGVITSSTAATLTIGSVNSGNGNYPGQVTGAVSLTKTGTGTIGLSDSNSYSGATNINAGTLIARNASAFGTGAVSVAAGAGLNYIATASSGGAALSLSNLTINGGSGTVVGASIGGAATKDEISVTGTATTTSGAVQVNINGTGAAAVSGTYTLIHTAGGSLSNATYALGTVYNNTNFTVGSLNAPTATDLTLPITPQTALTTAFWTGGLSGAPSVWAASNGTTTSNWAATNGGAAQPLVPGGAADVTISSSSVVTAPTSTSLGADMSIKGLTIADTTNGLGLNADAYTLTIGVDGITVNSGVPTSTIAANVTAGVSGTTSETWTNNSANPLTFSGTIAEPGGGPLILGGGTFIFSGANTFSRGLTITSGTLIMSGAGTIGNGSLGVTMSPGAVLDLNGTNQSMAVPLGTGGTILNNASGTNSVLTIGNNTGTGTFPGNIVDHTSGTGTLALIKGGNGGVTLTGSNTYSGATTINGKGDFIAGSATALSPNSPITATFTAASVAGQDTLDVSQFSNSVASLNFIEGTLALGLGNTLSASGNGVINIASTNTVVTVAGTTSPATVGIYHLLAAPGGLSYNTALPTNPDTANYKFVTSSTALDLQHIQDQALSAPSPATLNIIAGASTPISATLTNTAPTGSAALNVSLADNGSTGGSVSALSASTGTTVTSGSPATVSGTYTAGATAGTGFAWNIKNTDANALTTTATTGGIVNIYTHSTASFTSANNTPDGNPGATIPGSAITTDTINLGTFNQGDNSGSEPFTLGNILANLGVNAAGLELSSVTPNGGNVSQIGLTVPTFTGAGSLAGNSIETSFGTATLDTTTTGSFSNTYTLNLEDDQRVAGANAIGSETLTLILDGIISTSGPANLFFTGSAGNGNWDTTTTNFVPTAGGSPVAYSDSNHDNVTFDDTVANSGHNMGQFNIAIQTGGVSPGTMTVTGTTPYTFTGGNIGSPTHNTALTVASGASMTFDRGSGSRVTLELGSLSNSGLIDLKNNTMLLHNADSMVASTVRSELQSGYNTGGWNGTTGIISSTAQNDTLHTLGETLSGTDLTVAYTYYGDADLSGVVDGTDYSVIDAHNGLTSGGTWQTGDFNYDGTVDGSDYSLIDNAFNMQNGGDAVTAAQVATNTSEIAGGSTGAVPEPASLGLLGVGAIGFMSRRRRKV